MGVTPEELIRLGLQVEQFLENEAVQDVWAALEEIYYKNWKTADTAQERDVLWARVRALGDLRDLLEKTATIGQDEAKRRELAESES